MTARRIVSFLPSATEIACALGLEDQLVGITHECDYPASVTTKPVVVHSAVPVETMTQSEIDEAVSARLRQGLSVYLVDEKLLQNLRPDLILTQDLCQVCAPSGNEVTQALNALPQKPQVLWLTPKCLREIDDNLREVGKATGHEDAAEALIASGRSRVEKIRAVTDTLTSRPRVFCMEWIDPVYCSGHWVPEMVRIAGGIDQLSREGTDSVRIAWDDVVKWAPEVLVIMPCGYDLEETLGFCPALSALPGWSELPAVRNGRVYAVDANSYFARPGPRVIDGMAHLIHPELFPWKGAADAYRSLTGNTLETIETSKS
jgi:iron complex transport system substrate-binding protein